LLLLSRIVNDLKRLGLAAGEIALRKLKFAQTGDGTVGLIDVRLDVIEFLGKLVLSLVRFVAGSNRAPNVLEQYKGAKRPAEGLYSASERVGRIAPRVRNDKGKLFVGSRVEHFHDYCRVTLQNVRSWCDRSLPIKANQTNCAKRDDSRI
jgi:hypothetical protein